MLALIRTLSITTALLDNINPLPESKAPGQSISRMHVRVRTLTYQEMFLLLRSIFSRGNYFY